MSASTLRFALINPPSETVGRHSNRRATRVLEATAPYGQALIAGVARNQGAEVKVWDLVADPIPHNVFLDQLSSYGPDVIGFSVLGPAFHWLQAAAPDIRSRLSGAKLIAGNALPSEYPVWFLSAIPEIDVVFRGEAETSFARWLSDPTDTTIAGVVRRGDKPEESSLPDQIKDLDALPRPAWDAYPLHKYISSPQFLMGHNRFLPVMQSRGCPWDCSYCAQNFAWPRTSFRSIPSLVEELAWLHRDFSIKHYAIIDSIFPVRKQDGERLLQEMERHRLTGSNRLWLGGETRVDMVWDDTYRALAKAGLKFTMLGIESASEVVLQSQKKHAPGKYASPDQAVQILKKHGIRAYGLFMVGFPGETDADRLATEKLLLSLPFDMASVGLYSHYAGSPAARDSGLPPEQLLNANFAAPDQHDELVAWQTRMMRKFFLRPGFIAKTMIRGEIPIPAMVRGGMQILRGMA